LHLRKGNWKHALARLNELLATYPDDINGHFYAGWCNYNLGQYEQAKVNFSACLQLEYSNFNEEANWYLALTYDKTGQHQDAKKMFQQIVNQQGHYAQQASKALRK
jgi:tetratricopeptide (TPR) repeat protein